MAVQALLFCDNGFYTTLNAGWQTNFICRRYGEVGSSGLIPTSMRKSDQNISLLLVSIDDKEWPPQAARQCKMKLVCQSALSVESLLDQMRKTFSQGLHQKVGRAKSILSLFLLAYVSWPAASALRFILSNRSV
jgi:hypothetical protein